MQQARLNAFWVAVSGIQNAIDVQENQHPCVALIDLCIKSRRKALNK
jgi:hypothetical protein